MYFVVSSRRFATGGEGRELSLSSLCDLLSRFDGCASSLEDIAEAMASCVDARAKFAAWAEARDATAAARSAWVTGTCMPSDGSERDLRRVLYGMITTGVGGWLDISRCDDVQTETVYNGGGTDGRSDMIRKVRLAWLGGSVLCLGTRNCLGLRPMPEPRTQDTPLSSLLIFSCSRSSR